MVLVERGPGWEAAKGFLRDWKWPLIMVIVRILCMARSNCKEDYWIEEHCVNSGGAGKRLRGLDCTYLST